MKVTFLAVRLGDRNWTVRGWLVVAHGAIRGIMSETPEGNIHYGYACDRRCAPVDGYMLFYDLVEASKWFDERL